jgi:hypothetical protein
MDKQDKDKDKGSEKKDKPKVVKKQPGSGRKSGR